ncbi:MAG: hypothetical protein K9N52_10440 [Verrucomicrobia bacterium]|nr:hypothetical protein [Verrucomicrobiota bacterium]
MRFFVKLLSAALLCPVMFLLTGCGGISASPSVSPASFFIPGMVKDNSTTTTNSIAQQRHEAGKPPIVSSNGVMVVQR